MDEELKKMLKKNVGSISFVYPNGHTIETAVRYEAIHYPIRGSKGPKRVVLNIKKEFYSDSNIKLLNYWFIMNTSKMLDPRAYSNTSQEDLTSKKLSIVKIESGE